MAQHVMQRCLRAFHGAPGLTEPIRHLKYSFIHYSGSITLSFGDNSPGGIRLIQGFGMRIPIRARQHRRLEYDAVCTMFVPLSSSISPALLTDPQTFGLALRFQF